MNQNANVLTDDRYKEHIEFWKGCLGQYEGNFNFTQTLETSGNLNRASHIHDFHENTQTLLNRLSGGDALGEFVLLIAGFHYLLQLYGNASLSSLNTPLLTENDLGRGFTPYVPLLSVYKGEQSIRDFVKETQNNVSLAYSYQNFPINDIFEIIHEKPTVYGSNIFVRYAQIHAQKEDKVYQDHDLVFDLYKKDGKLGLEIDYRDDMFISAFIKRIGQHLENYIANYEDLSVTVDTIEILSPDEKERLLNGFRGDDTRPITTTIPALFSEQATKTPDHPALRYKNTVLTYRELHERTDAMANYLREEYGLKKEEVVAVLIPKSELSIIAMMAIMKAGGCYLPLHEASPPERLKQFCDQAQVKVVLTHSELLPKMKLLYSIPMFVMDIQLSGIEPVALSSLEELTADDLAYIIFTSGSSGTPKGVMVEHKSIVNIVEDYIKEFDINEQDNYLQLLSLSFDGSVLDILASLLSGAQLILPHKEVLADTNELESFVDRHQVTLMVTTASYLSSLRQLPLKSIRLIVSAGERARVEDAKYYSGFKKFYNAYGPTECTVDTTLFQVDALRDYEKIPIGLPRRNCNIYILDDKHKLLPEGITGEICIAGLGLARGYLSEEGQESPVFMENPLVRGERIYKTGDLGYWNAEGFLEYVDRKDRQVKIRGYRVDTLEIENEVRKLDGVSDAVVLVRKDKDDSSSIICYVVGGAGVDADYLKSALGKKLPDYMMPELLTKVDKIPLTANGKVDVDSLSEMGGHRSEEAYLPPRNRVEEKLVGIWKKLFDLPEVGVRDNFFELGGHSLNSIKFISEIFEEFHFKIDPVGIFKNPTIEELAIHIQNAKRDDRSIESLAPASHYALSNGQRRLWALHQFSKDQYAYNIPNRFSLQDIEYERFKEAYALLIDRHEILRTVFLTIEGQARQVIHEYDERVHGIEYFDIREEREKEKLVKMYSREMATFCFDLSQAPLIIGKLVRVSERDYLFFLTMHHIIGDGWSQGLIIKEMTVLYDALRTGDTAPLPPLKFQYKDYAAWQQRSLVQESSSKHKTYWKETLSGPLPKLNLPCDFPRPPIMTQNGGLHYFSLSTALTDSLGALSRKNEVSLFITLFTALKVLLFKYTGDTDIILGMTTAGRNDHELKDQIGFYVNLLPLRTMFQREDSFESLLHRVKDNVFNGLEHQGYPFEQIVSDLSVERDTSRSPLFDVLVELLNVDTGLETISEIGGKSFGSFDTDYSISKYDLTVKFKEFEGLRVYIEYNSDLFKKDRILNMERHLRELLNSIVLNPSAKIGHIDILPEKEIQLLQQYAVAPRISFPERSIIELFEDQVEKSPDAVALLFEGKSITYRELNSVANNLAQELKNNYSLRVAHVVAVIAGRSDNVIIGMLAILKAGGIFLPIEPTYPTKRIGQILKDARVHIVLTNTDDVHRLSGTYTSQWFAMDVQMPLLKKQEGVTATKTDFQSIAYMIYTSGSTGVPKGVKISHKSISNYVFWANGYYFEEGERFSFPFFTSLSFDLTLTSIWCTLTTGNRLFISGDKELGETLKDIFSEKSEITAIKLTPSLIEVLEHLSIDSTHINLVIAGGEVLDERHFRTLKKMNPDLRLFNEYGPTEATIGCVVNEIKDVENLKFIGKPIANTEIYIVDEGLNTKPLGSVGEICIGGACLALGYHNLPELNLRKFVPSPFGFNGEMLYLSGDLGLWNQNGHIEFLGRKDEQLKVNGARIEPLEVERSLLEFDGILQVAALGEESANDEIKLTCYYTSSKRMTENELRLHLEGQLPKFMIPSLFVQLKEMPLSKNGKIDKHRLAGTARVEEVISENVEEPENEIQEYLVGLWKEVLNKGVVSINDNFFNIGGDSLKVIELNVKINEQYPDVVEVYNIFSNPTPKQLESFISQQNGLIKPKIKKIQKIEL